MGTSTRLPARNRLDSMTPATAVSSRLKGDDLARFGLARADLDHSREVLLGGLEVAHSACGLLTKAEAALTDRESGFVGPRC
jgi:hypothetical protein